MLRRPIVGITAVNGFVSASQVFTLLPKSAGYVDTGRSELPIDPPRHHARRNFSPNRSALTRRRKVRTLILLSGSDHGPHVSPVCNIPDRPSSDLRSHFSLVPNRSQGVERSCRPQPPTSLAAVTPRFLSARCRRPSDPVFGVALKGSTQLRRPANAPAKTIAAIEPLRVRSNARWPSARAATSMASQSTSMPACILASRATSRTGSLPSPFMNPALASTATELAGPLPLRRNSLRVAQVGEITERMYRMRGDLVRLFPRDLDGGVILHRSTPAHRD